MWHHDGSNKLLEYDFHSNHIILFHGRQEVFALYAGGLICFTL